MKRPLRRAVPALALALLASACGDDAAPVATATDAPAASDAATEASESSTTAADDADTGAPDDAEGEPRAEDALFGVEVCEALLPVVTGDATDGPARPFILAELAPEPGYVPEAQDIEAWDGDPNDAGHQTCNVSAGGDAWYEIALLGDGHVGLHGVGIVLRSSYETPDDIALAVEDAALAGDLCEGNEPQDHDVFDLTGNQVVAVQCDFFAYQGLFEFWWWSGYDLRPLPTEVWSDGAITDESSVVGFPGGDGFDLIENLEKARGVGDCGTFSSWFLADDLSLDLAYVTHRDCDDSAEGGDAADPSTWDLVYEAP